MNRTFVLQVREAICTERPAIAHIQADEFRTAYAAYFPESYLEHVTYEEETYERPGVYGSVKSTAR